VKLTVFGATGPTGQHIVRQALDAGHEVTAFVRPSSRTLDITSDRLHVVTGGVTTDACAAGDAVCGREAVISVLGVGKSFTSTNLIARSVNVIIPAMELHGVRRLIFTSAFGVGASRRDSPLIPRIMFRLMLNDVYADKKIGEDAVSRSGLNWTLVCPTILTDGPATGKYRAGEHLELHGLPKISRADVGHFILTQLADTTRLRKAVVISD